MVQSNKVLTVSYGTFSCTLEGFEDSFDTMKAIAEYFRDLAADDRYFGAEPPQPDTEMLARIAEREIARQVEARREGAGYVLRAAAPAALTEATPAAQTAPQAAPQAAAEPAPAEQIAEELAEVEAETASTALEELAEEPQAAEPEAVQAQGTEAEEIGVSAAAAAFMAQAETVSKEVEAFEPEAEELEAEPVAEVAPKAQPAQDPESIAAKLQRIRAVVSRNEAATVEADYSEDEHFADAFAAPAEEAMEEAEDIAETEEEVVETRAVAAEADEDAAEGDIAEGSEEDPFAGLPPRRAARLRRRMERAQQAAENEAEAAAEAALHARAARAEVYDGDEDDVNGGALFADLDAEPEDDHDGERGGNILTSGTGRGADRRRPRVMIVKRDEFEDREEARAPLMPSAELPPSTLPPADEADLMRELAEVEAELRGENAEARPEQEAAAAEPRAVPQPAREDTSDLSRLMAAADERLDAAEAAAARETYSHLRAAVAATQAERSSGGSVETNPDAAPYRADLARVVQPRRPRPGSLRRARPEAEEVKKPAPLKLVAEQRVDDMPEPAPKSGPVRPRRIAAAVETPAQGAASEGFAAFAEEMGAQELPELLEAAAAYMQFVEGRDQFTRPQLIHKAREAADDEFSREDGLRSFGMLLREGKIVKKDSGRFIASGDIGFQPASSRAAG